MSYVFKIPWHKDEDGDAEYQNNRNTDNQKKSHVDDSEYKNQQDDHNKDNKTNHFFFLNLCCFFGCREISNKPCWAGALLQTELSLIR